MAPVQDIRTRPDAAAVAANPVAEAPGNPVATAQVEQGVAVLGGESLVVLTAPAAVENAGPRATAAPSRRDGWLWPIELDERADESRSPAAGRELAAKPTLKPGGIRAHALSLTVPDPFLLDVTIIPRPF